MSLENVREQNIRMAVAAALDCFREQGISKTRVSEIARRCGLTERSLFRYFKTKADLVLAASYLYWERVIARMTAQLPPADAPERRSLTGLEEIRMLLNSYSGLYLEDPNGIRFTLDAEITLNSAGKLNAVQNRPPEPYETSSGPVASAIRKGLADGSISPEVDVRELYYNAYDTILGVMQRLSVGGTPSAGALDYRTRMRHLSDLLVQGFRGG